LWGKEDFEVMGSPKNPTIFYGAIVAAIVSIVLCIYYAVPGYNHILVTHDPMASHATHVVAFAAITAICIVAALVTRPKSAIK